MRTLELFSGTKSFSKVARELGHGIFTIDNNANLEPDVAKSIFDFKFNEIRFIVDVLWASPPCTGFSVASIGRHWTGGKNAYIPKSETAVEGLKLLDRTIESIVILRPKIWFIENTRGMMRKVIDDIFKKWGIIDYKRVTLSYCQYGDDRMKPTDIWTNCESWIPRTICKNGDGCHVSAPRGSKTGTQGLKGAKERGVIPPALFKEIFNSV